ncbi:DUF4231 domain-containing protein [Chitinilyticum piscinae]|uniref:DUF4231 domain-containing protein n=1 Tax=Chitinilyticum piscinae TaxID=2866724 RepID=A0A8J7FM29_9NEIS|nr:DUF4231 domain-containing protein [Chitinilyticum piscinae]MBE9610422.1 DUF4231 domain-containing protein [Chitinilyticum piscinae]
MHNDLLQHIEQQHPDSRVRFLLARINHFEHYASLKSKKLKRITYVLRFSLLGLAAISTIVLGLDVAGLAPYAKNIALVLGAVMTFLGGVSSFLNIEEYWMRHNTIHLRLKALRDRLAFQCSNLQLIEDEALNAILSEYHAITESNIKYWQDAIAEQKA